MQVFKAFFKIIKKHLPQLSIYIVIFAGISILFSSNAKPTQNMGFSGSQAKIAVLNRDGDSPVAEGLTSYLSKTCELVELEDKKESLQDALYFRNAEYIVTIPSGFSQAFMEGTDPTIEKAAIPDSTSALFVDLLIDRYFQTLRLYTDCLPQLTQQQLVNNCLEDLNETVEVTLKQFSLESPQQQGAPFYFRYMGYIMLAIITLGISSILMVFQQKDLNRRNLCSPISNRSVNLQLALGCLIFSVSCWIIFLFFSVLLYGDFLLHSQLFGLFCLNSLALTLVCISIGFLVGIFIKSYNTQSAVSNVISLGMSFFCGVFVPQEVMPSSVLAVARFLPIYWYVDANDSISTLPSFSWEQVQPIISSILIQLGFAAAIFAVALAASKQRRQREA